MSETAQFRRAKFTILTGPDKGSFDVHFNPASLSYTITNNYQQTEGENKVQFVGSSTGKLTMDLIFDTTHDGEDVRVHTEKIAKMMKPADSQSDAERVPPKVQFGWGVYTFEGVVESYKETLDFFAPTGIPLRAAVNLTLSSQTDVFDAEKGAAVDVKGALKPDAVVIPPAAAKKGAADVARKAGDPRAARALGAASGQESLRFGGGKGGIAVGASLKASASFAPTAKGSAAGGAFASLGGSARVSAGGRLDAKALLPGAGASAATDRNATFGVGGKATVQGSASLKADVGAAGLRGRITFGEG